MRCLIEFALQVERHETRLVAGHGNMGPDPWQDRARGNDHVVDLGTAPKASKARSKVEVKSTPAQQQTIRVGHAASHAHPGLQGKGTIDGQVGVSKIVASPIQVQDRNPSKGDLGPQIIQQRIGAQGILQAGNSSGIKKVHGEIFFGESLSQGPGAVLARQQRSKHRLAQGGFKVGPKLQGQGKSLVPWGTRQGVGGGPTHGTARDLGLGPGKEQLGIIAAHLGQGFDTGLRPLGIAPLQERFDIRLERGETQLPGAAQQQIL